MTQSSLTFDDDRAPFFTVGQVADMLGIQPSFLRLLDTEAVVQPARSDGGQRRYSRQEIHDVQRVMSLKDEGLTLAGIRRIMALETELHALRRQITDLQSG